MTESIFKNSGTELRELLLTELKTLFIRRFYRHFTPNGFRISGSSQLSVATEFIGLIYEKIAHG